MFRFTVLYGHPQDPAEFERYYREIHMPLAVKIRGLRGLTTTKFGPGPDGEQPPYYRMASLFAGTAEEFGEIMATPEGKAASDDLPNFATGGVTVVYGDEDIFIPVA
ncbi:MAG TPA: EthD family reductase [Ktedonobacteraceae bacterium]|nr:EthD family reductase [Ktedonobacteraceae bacterium]